MWAIGEADFLKAMSIVLPVVIQLYTPYIHAVTQMTIVLILACGKQLSICSIIVLPTLMDMVSTTIDLASMQAHMPNWSCRSIRFVK